MISVIIPILEEEKRIRTLIDYLNSVETRKAFETIVVDGGGNSSVLNQLPATARYIQSEKGRAIQMNAGARIAMGDLLYFVHADALPPPSFPEDISKAITGGFCVGCFRMKLVPESFLTNINSFFSRFNGRFSGGGDQTLFVTREIFEKEGGFNEDFCIMEDFEFVRRLKPKYGFHVIQKDVQVSARKYQANNYWKVNLANYKAFRMFENKVNPALIKETYYSWIKRGE